MDEYSPRLVELGDEWFLATRRYYLPLTWIEYIDLHMDGQEYGDVRIVCYGNSYQFSGEEADALREYFLNKKDDGSWKGS